MGRLAATRGAAREGVLDVPLPANESERLAALHSCGVLDTRGERRFDVLTRLAARHCAAPIAALSLVDESRQWFKSRCGIPMRETPREGSFCTYTILGESLLVVPDATRDARFCDSPLVVNSPFLRSYAGAPVYVESGFCVGALCVADSVARDFSDEELRILVDLADVASSLLELKRLQQMARLLEAA